GGEKREEREGRRPFALVIGWRWPARGRPRDGSGFQGADAILGGELHLLELRHLDLLGGGERDVATELPQALLDRAVLVGQLVQEIFLGRTHGHTYAPPL